MQIESQEIKYLIQPFIKCMNFYKMSHSLNNTNSNLSTIVQFINLVEKNFAFLQACKQDPIKLVKANKFLINEIDINCNKDEYTIRYIREECDDGYCQKCRIPVFNCNQCPAKHIMKFDTLPDDGYRFINVITFFFTFFNLEHIMCDFCGEYPYTNEEEAFSDKFCYFDICNSCFQKMSE